MTLLVPNHHWVCPNCTAEDVTHEAQPHTRFHDCAGFNGFSMPMIPAGSKAKVEIREREDYVGDEQVTYHQGRPIMSVVTTREDGSNDVAVFAPTATAKGAAHGSR